MPISHGGFEFTVPNFFDLLDEKDGKVFLARSRLNLRLEDKLFLETQVLNLLLCKPSLLHNPTKCFIDMPRILANQTYMFVDCINLGLEYGDVVITRFIRCLKTEV